MKLRMVHLLEEQKFFTDRPTRSVDPTREGVEMEMLGDWIFIRCVSGSRKGEMKLLHGSRTTTVEPAEDPTRTTEEKPKAPLPVINTNQGQVRR